MANLNKVMLIGRLTRDPEMILTDKGVKFGFAVNNSKKDQVTGQWVDEPVFIDCEMWNREPSFQATRLFQTVRKGQQLFIEGRLRLDTWEDKNGGGKRSQLRVVVEAFQYLEPKPEGAGGGAVRAAPRPAAAQPTRNVGGYEEYEDSPAPVSRGGDDDIPF
jgi:single-strand DNA-binding protein